MSKDHLLATDKRTGRVYELPIVDGAVRAADFRRIKLSAEDFRLLCYDPAFLNTASCRSFITLIDGDKGILRYRGYPIEELAQSCTFLEVAYLLLFGELPAAKEYEEWTHQITHHTMIHENFKRIHRGLSPRRAPPWSWSEWP